MGQQLSIRIGPTRRLSFSLQPIAYLAKRTVIYFEFLRR